MTSRQKAVADAMVSKWPSGIVARTQIKEFSGGLFTPKYLRRLDNETEIGPPKEIIFKSKSKVFYDSQGLATWIASQIREAS